MTEPQRIAAALTDGTGYEKSPDYGGRPPGVGGWLFIVAVLSALVAAVAALAGAFG